jgi:pullulanase
MSARFLARAAAAIALLGGALVLAPAAPAHSASPLSADAGFLDGDALITAGLSGAIDLSGAHPSDFVVTDTTTDAAIPVTGVTDLAGAATGQSAALHLQLASAPDVTHTVTLNYKGTGAVTVFPRDVLNESRYFYGGTDLGNVYSPSSTTFRVWAPVASAVSLVVYRDQAGDVLTDEPMTRSDNGTWFDRVQGDLKNMYYFYRVTNLGHTRPAMDPYATNIPPNGVLSGHVENGAQGFISQVVDLSSTDPAGWSSDTYRKTTHPTDAVIYEVHVRDFSIDPNSGMTNRGKYLAFTETGTKNPAGQSTGVDSLKQLGITHVELLPVQSCGTLDEIAGGSTSPAPAGNASRYKWCYDPVQYDVLNGAYATNPDGTARITEYKEMVMALHRQGLGVIQDVVYPHTFSNASFDPLVPRYYYRTTNDGAEERNSGAGPDVAAERPMVRKFILDSVAYLMKQFHIDGFRFDQMTLLGKGTLTALSQEAHQINPSTVLLGEEFDQGATLEGDVQVTFGEQKGLHVGGLNYDIRGAVRGSNPGDAGYATGDPILGGRIPTQLVGNIDYEHGYSGWTQLPEEAINYASNHDGQTLWDGINAANANESEATRIRMDELAQTIIFTSQGVPFMQGGEEFLRTKGGDANSDTGGDAENQLDWSRKNTYASVFNYYANLIHFRSAHSAFRMDNPATIKKDLKFLKSKTFAVGFELSGHANGDKWKNIVALYNPFQKGAQFILPRGKWTVVATAGKIGEKALGHATKKVTIPAYSAMILHQ